MAKGEYVNNNDLVALIVLYKESPEDPVIREELAKTFLVMAREIYAWQKLKSLEEDAAVNEAAFACMEKALRCFDVNRKSGFAYFTTLIINHFRQMLRTQGSYVRAINEYRKQEARKHGFHIGPEEEERPARRGKGGKH